MKNYDKKEKRVPVLFTLLFGILAATIGTLALLGWILGVPVLASFSSGLIPMAPSTALLFISFGAAVLLCTRFPKSSWYYRVGIIISSIGTLIALLLFFLSSLGIHLAVEHLGFKVEGLIAGTPFGNISPLTAFCFVLAGLSFLISLSSSKQQKLMFAAFSFAFLVALVSILLLLDHLFGTPLLYGTQFIPPALSTSLALFFLGIALIALISPKIWQYKSEHDAASTRSSIILILVFGVLAVGIISVGYFYYIRNEKEFRLGKEREISFVADLKISVLTHIRKGWVENASLFYDNTVFSTLVDRYFNNPKDIEAHRQLRTWLSQFKIVNQYNNLCLHDAKGIERFALPDSLRPHSSTFDREVSEVIKSGKITIADFYRNEYDQHIYLNIFVPILDPKNNSRVNGVLSLRIDPESYLYPYIKSWPTQSKTSETMLVRREGNDVLYLNDVKLKQNTALSLRIPLQNKTVLEVRAVLGEEGIVEGYDYKGVKVIADIRAIPNSPWFIVAKVDIAEVYAPLRERLWMMIFLITALLFGAGASVAVVWRQQRVQFYKERYSDAERIQKLNRVYAVLSNINQVIVRVHDIDRLFNEICRIAIEDGKFLMAWIGMVNTDSKKVEVVASAGFTSDYLAKINIDLNDEKRSQGPTGRTIISGDHFISNDIEHDESMIPWRDGAKKHGYKSAASFPLKIFGETNGCFNLYSSEVGFFDEDEIKLLDELAMDISFALEFIEREAQRKRAEEALRENEERLRTIIETEPECVKIVDRDGQLLEMNAAGLAMLEAESLNEVQQHTLFNFILPEYRAPFETLHKRVMSGENGILEFEVMGLRGTRRWLETHAAPMRDATGEVVKLLGVTRDITERKRFEESLKKQKDEFETIFNLVPAQIWYKDTHNNFIRVNRQVCTDIGMTNDKIEGHSAEELFPSFAQQYFKDDLEVFNARKPKLGISEQVNTANGEIRWVHTDKIPVFGNEGEVNGLIAFVQDITERKRAEEELHKIGTAIEQTADCVVITDREGVIQYVNMAFTKITGYSKEEALGKTQRILKSGLHSPQFYETLWKTILSGEVFNATFINKRKDGELIYEIKTVTPIKDKAGNITNFVSTAKEITEQRRAEEALRESEERFRNLVENINEVFYIADGQGKIFYCSPSITTATGYSLQEIIGKSFLRLIAPIDRRIVLDNYLEQTTKGVSDTVLVFRVRCKDGKIIWAEQITRIVYDTFGNVVEYRNVARDITERKRAEEELKISHKTYLGIINSLTEAIYIQDENGVFLEVNKTAEKFYGYPREYFIGKTPGLISAPGKNDIPMIAEAVKKAFNGEPQSFEFWGLRKNGTIFPKSVNLTSGEYFGKKVVIATARDITERKRAEKEISMLANALRSVNECVSITDLEDKLLFVNESFIKTYGYSEEELIGKKNMLIVRSPNNPPELVGEILPATLRGGWNGELWNKRKDGSEFPIYLSTTIINDKDGNPLGLIGVAKDITERKRAEQEIISQKNRFAQLFENSPIAIALLDDQDKIVHINESFSALFGYFFEEIKGQLLNDIIVPPELKEEAKSYSDQTREGNQINKESYRKKKDGTLVYVQIVGVPVTVNDKTVGIYGMYVDLTQRKEAEEKMKSAKELAEQSDKLKSEFLAQMSHEIRTPMNIMLGNVDYLSELFGEKMDSEARHCFDGIHLASRRIIRTIDLILNVSELQTSGYKPLFKKVDLNSEVLNKLFMEHQLSAKQKGLELTYTCREKSLKVLADEYSITQIFANLIDNAIKYTKKGTVEILLGKNRTGNIMVEIKDTGIGMSKEFLPRMFEPFVQEEQGYTRSFEGNGLGLALTKRYCDINNAVIEVESEKGIGTTFRVIFK